MIEINDIENVESAFEVEKIKMNKNIFVWPLFRQFFYFQLLKKKTAYNNKLRTRNKIKLFKNFFYGTANLFKLNTFDYFFFSNTSKRLSQHNVFYDIYFDAIADKLGQKKSLFVEWAQEKHLPSNKVHSKHVISDLIFKLFITIYSFFIKLNIKNQALLDSIMLQYDLDPNYHKQLKLKLAEFYVYSLLFKKYRPKAIFLLSSFTKTGIVLAAKQLNIPVVEAQHGYIGDSHPFYKVTKYFEGYYPDYLLSFGNYEKVTQPKHFIFKDAQILPVGSLQMEIEKSKKTPKKLIELTEVYEKTFCITLQSIKDAVFIEWVSEQARAYKNFLFLIRPRGETSILEKKTMPINVIETPQFTIYDVLKVADYNITLFSTTAIEGIFFNCTPIFYNLENLSKKYFDFSKTKYFLIQQDKPLNYEELKKYVSPNNHYFLEGYFKNIDKLELCF